MKNEEYKVVNMDLRQPLNNEPYDDDFFKGYFTQVQYGQILQQLTKLTNQYLTNRYRYLSYSPEILLFRAFST